MNLKNIKSPFVILLIGTPLSGKSTWIKKNFPDTNVISRDEIVMEVYGSKNYNDAFDNVDQKKVNDILKQRLYYFSNLGENVIIDMTNMSSKRRKNSLSYFSNNYYKLGIIFPILTDEEYIKRNEKRRLEENKNININIIKTMISSYQIIGDDEGFDKIISL